MTPVILASTSSARRALLAAAGLAHEALSPNVDESLAKVDLLARGADPAGVAVALAGMKALAVSRQRPDALVIGADQTLDLEGQLFDKAESLEAARERLVLLRGRTHLLHSAVAVARDGVVVWSTAPSARLTMRDFSDRFLDDWLERQGSAVLGSVGCYRLEDEGVQLFSQIDGDYFTILGLPLVGLLAFFRQQGVLAA
jgi:septum formation protein